MLARSFLVIGILMVILSPRRATGQVGDEMYRTLVRGVRTVSVAVIGDGGQLSLRGGYSTGATQAAVELKLREAGLRVVSLDARDSSNALLMIMTTCVPRQPACAMSATLTRFSYIAGTRQRIAGEIWTSGPSTLTNPNWVSEADTAREWAVDQAEFVANLILSVR